ncbi:MAG: hypothetical protein R2716_05800 [Microthrixaceae bacterium]
MLANMEFFTHAAGLPSGEIEGALDRLEVASRLRDVPVRGSPSTGQRRRVSFATAMVVRRPELWLLDEPHSGLDEAGRDLVDSLLEGLGGRGDRDIRLTRARSCRRGRRNER